MAEKKVGIVAECVCDLPRDIVEKYDISMLYFLIETDTGIFTDSREITTENILSYIIAGGKKSSSMPPEPEIYANVFTKKLGDYDEIILVAISEGVSNSCKNARKALEDMGETLASRVHIYDSANLSTGLGFMVMRAAELAEEGFSAAEIIAALDEMKPKVTTTFITENVNFLYRNGRVSRFVKRMVDIFKIRPVLEMKNGVLTLRSVQMGKYEPALRRYLKKELRHYAKIDTRRVFLTHTGCTLKTLGMVRSDIEKKCRFKETLTAKVSATVSSNCGPNTFGMIYVKKC